MASDWFAHRVDPAVQGLAWHVNVDSTAQRPTRIAEHLGPRIAALATQLVGLPPAG